MPDWVLWAVIAAALAAGEAVTTSFFLGPVALAAVLVAAVAALGLGLEIQLVVFMVASVASLGLLRPVAKRHLRTPARTRTGAARLVGSPALVIEQVTADRGLVKIEGETWSARAFDDDQVIEPGERVEVLQIQGATALVLQ